jgi:hypothetical protein
MTLTDKNKIFLSFLLSDSILSVDFGGLAKNGTPSPKTSKLYQTKHLYLA